MEKMIKLINDNGIRFGYADFTYPLRGIYVEKYGVHYIGIAQDIDTLAERRSVLAEELGHYFTSVGNAVECHCYADRISIDKTEYKAMKWAAMYLIPDERLREAMICGLEPWELADYFTVTEKFMDFRLEVMRCAKESKEGR